MIQIMTDIVVALFTILFSKRTSPKFNGFVWHCIKVVFAGIGLFCLQIFSAAWVMGAFLAVILVPFDFTNTYNELPELVWFIVVFHYIPALYFGYIAMSESYKEFENK